MDVKLPKLGEGSESGTIVSVFVKEGDVIAKGQTLIELENEKAVAPIPSTASGTITKLRVKEGDKISVGQVIATVSEAEPAVVRPPTPVAEPIRAETGDREAKRPAPKTAEPLEPLAKAEGVEPGPSGLPPAASPSIRKMARELGLDLARVRGSESGGRIVLADLRAYVQHLQKLAFPSVPPKPEKAAAPVAERIDFSKWGEISRKPMSALRQTISRRMLENWNAIPHVTQFDEADVTGPLELRRKHAPAYEQKGVRLTLTPFILKAVASVLKRHPIFNSSLDEATQEIILKEYFHLGLAVDTDQGLLVPVMRNVDQKSLLELSREINELAEKARARKMSLDEMKGGTFTISNQGGIGGAHFTPIINKPEVAILGLGRGALKPVVRKQGIEPRTMLPLCLSYDHRVIDGGSAARFMVDLVQELENSKEADVTL